MTVKHTLVSLDMRVFALCSLMELHRSQKARTRPKAVHPLCTGKRRGDLRAGIDAGGVLHCAGHGVYHYHPIGQLRDEQRDTAAGVDRCH